MNLPSASTRTAVSVESGSGVATRLRGGLLVLARVFWGALVVLTLGIFVASLPENFAQQQTICFGTACAFWQPTPATVQTLHALGLSFSSYATFSVLLRVASTLLCIGVAMMIVWRKSDDWMALLVALWLVIVGVVCSTFTVGLGYSLWRLPSLVLFFLCFSLSFLVFCLFPDGRLMPGWMRWLFVGWVGLNVFDFFPEISILSLPFVLIWYGSMSSCAVAQIYRYRKVASPIQRQQTKWVVFALAIVSVMYLGLFSLYFIFPSFLRPGSLYKVASVPLYIFIAQLFPLSIGIAILRYRLWDIDIIINRTLVYGVLTVSIVAIYILVVVGLGTLLQTQNNAGIALLATGLVAVLFQPLRNRLQRVVNRFMYGDRDDPYRVLSRLGQRLEATLAPHAVLPTIVETVAQALKLPYAAIILKRGDEFTPAASYGTSRGELLRFPLIYQTEQVGELVLAPRSPGESFTSADRKLLADLGHQAGVAAHAVRLADDLKQLTIDLQHSRERLVTAREEERRRLRRDLHDGLGPQLAGLTLKLETARNRLAHDALADTLLSDLTGRTQAAVVDIRRLVYALRPPALDELGLLPALREHALQYSDQGDNGLHISLDIPDCLPELSAAVEVAVYRIAQEALTNVVRHAHARHCTIYLTLDETAGVLTLEVRDDGGGMIPASKTGVGLVSMRERAEELGGTWTIQPIPTGGTCVLVELPYRPPTSPDAKERHPRSLPPEEEN